MDTFYLVLLVLSALCFLGAAGGRAAVGGDGVGRDGVKALALLPLGLFFWVLVPVIETARTVF